MRTTNEDLIARIVHPIADLAFLNEIEKTAARPAAKDALF
jgi:hypothetical protein